MIRYLILVFVLSLAVGFLILRHTPESTFIEGVVGQPIELNPAAEPRNEVDEAIEALLFRSLFKYDSTGRLIKDLVESYEIKDEGRVYEIKLKEGIFWQDGYPIAADDIKFTLSQDPTFTEATIEVVEDRLIRFELDNPLASFLSLLTKPIAPSHAVVAPSLRSGVQSSIVGSGNFKVREVKRNGGVNEIILQNLRGGEVGTLVFKFFQTQADLEEAAKRGEVDAFFSDSFVHPSFTKYTTPLYSRYFGIFFNLDSRNKLVKNPAFRKAAARKTPVTALINEVIKGEGKPMHGPMSGTWAEAKLPFPKFSSNLKGGYRGKIALTVPNVGKLPEIAKYIARSWRELGVKVTIDTIVPKKTEEIISSKNFEALILGQEVGRDPDRYSLWHSTQKSYPGLNISSYADPRADRALEEGRKASKKTERKRHYLNFQRLFLEDNPAIFLYHPNLNYFVSRRFSGIDLSPVFNPPDRFWNIQEWRSL